MSSDENQHFCDNKRTNTLVKLLKPGGLEPHGNIGSGVSGNSFSHANDVFSFIEDDELDAPTNPLLAAASAMSLYGSAAPYRRLREKAHEELSELIGLSDSKSLAKFSPKRLSSQAIKTSISPAKPAIRQEIPSDLPTRDIPLINLSTSARVPPKTPTILADLPGPQEFNLKECAASTALVISGKAALLKDSKAQYI